MRHWITSFQLLLPNSSVATFGEDCKFDIA
jgi:hypothetical protein